MPHPKRRIAENFDCAAPKVTEGPMDSGPNIPGIDATPAIPPGPVMGDDEMMGEPEGMMDTSEFLDPELDSPAPEMDHLAGPQQRDQDQRRRDRIAQDGQKQPIWRGPVESARRSSERSLVEAISNFLRDKANLGLPGDRDTEEVESVAQARVEGLYEAFALKFVDSPFYESVTRAFRKIHSYKYLDHPTFKLSLESEMKSTGVPTTEISKALSTVDALVEGFSKEPGERDAGWNLDRLEDLMDMTRNADRRKTEHEDPFNTPLHESPSDIVRSVARGGSIQDVSKGTKARKSLDLDAARQWRSNPRAPLPDITCETCGTKRESWRGTCPQGCLSTAG
jgi:hypothetical protein